MQEYISLRIDAGLGAALKQRAERLGLSLNAMASEIIRREVDYDVQAPGRPEALPVGLSSVSDAWQKDVEGTPSGQRNWGVLYEDGDGLFIGAVGSVEISPLFATITLKGSDRLVTTPRAKILGWRRLNSDYEILHFATGIQGWGAYLHEAVEYSHREQNGIYWPPRRGPATKLSGQPKPKAKR